MELSLLQSSPTNFSITSFVPLNDSFSPIDESNQQLDKQIEKNELALQALMKTTELNLAYLVQRIAQLEIALAESHQKNETAEAIHQAEIETKDTRIGLLERENRTLKNENDSLSAKLDGIAEDVSTYRKNLLRNPYRYLFRYHLSHSQATTGIFLKNVCAKFPEKNN